MTCDDWPIRWPCDITDVDEDLLAMVTSSAQSILWGLSGRRYGLCETTESYTLPCANGCVPFNPSDFSPGIEWRFDVQPRKCCRLDLHSRPVRAIVEVIENGITLDPDDYYLGRGVLYRIGQCWACDDQCDVPPIAVTYKYGIDVPDLGALAMGELACELLAGLNGADCRLPSNAISVTRQGVTVDLGDAQTLFEQGRIGLPISDAFLRQTNPGRLMSASTVHSPDMARRVR